MCSEPIQIQAARAAELITRVETKTSHSRDHLAETVRQIFNGFESRYAVRREQPRDAVDEDSEFDLPQRASEFDFASRAQRAETRYARLARLRSRARSEEDAVAAAVGIELWSLGIQLLLAAKSAD